MQVATSFLCVIIPTLPCPTCLHPLTGSISVGGVTSRTGMAVWFRRCRHGPAKLAETGMEHFGTHLAGMEGPLLGSKRPRVVSKGLTSPRGLEKQAEDPEGWRRPAETGEDGHEVFLKSESLSPFLGPTFSSLLFFSPSTH